MAAHDTAFLAGFVSEIFRARPNVSAVRSN